MVQLGCILLPGGSKMRVAKGTACEGGSMAGRQLRGAVATCRAEVAHLIARHIARIWMMDPAERHRAASDGLQLLSHARGLYSHSFESIFPHSHMLRLCGKIASGLVRHRRRARESNWTNMVCGRLSHPG